MRLKTQGPALTALTAVALGIAAGTATADPALSDAAQPGSLSVTLAPGIQYTDGGSNGAAVLTTPLGSVAMRAGQFDLRDGAGQTVAGTPIDTTGLAAEDTAAPAAAPAAAPVAEENTTAIDLLVAVKVANGHMASAFAVGGAAGSVIGAAIGCPFGILTGGTLLTAATAGTLILPVMAATCLVGAVAFGGLGATVGGLAVAIPVGIAAGTATFHHMQAERAAGRDPLQELQQPTPQ
ncbi:hypothetical protein AB0H76_11770 [Nocardia sp. NPDC050712]|uniref:hypothetical protein n=1 Tax=Nocardia sp. NPDC050712 TaxID=3155518 RepID=UPI0033C9876F